VTRNAVTTGTSTASSPTTTQKRIVVRGSSYGLRGVVVMVAAVVVAPPLGVAAQPSRYAGYAHWAARLAMTLPQLASSANSTCWTSSVAAQHRLVVSRWLLSGCHQVCRVCAGVRVLLDTGTPRRAVKTEDARCSSCRSCTSSLLSPKASSFSSASASASADAAWPGRVDRARQGRPLGGLVTRRPLVLAMPSNERRRCVRVWNGSGEAAAARAR